MNILYTIGNQLIAEFRPLETYDLISLRGFAESASKEYPDQYSLLLTAYTLYISMVDHPATHHDGESYFPFATRLLDQTKYIPMTFDNFAQLYIEYAVEIEAFHKVMTLAVSKSHPRFIEIFNKYAPDQKGDDP